MHDRRIDATKENAAFCGHVMANLIELPHIDYIGRAKRRFSFNHVENTRAVLRSNLSRSRRGYDDLEPLQITVFLRRS